MLTFFSSPQSTNGMLFCVFADSFLIRTCLGTLLFPLCSDSLDLDTHSHFIFSVPCPLSVNPSSLLSLPRLVLFFISVGLLLSLACLFARLFPPPRQKRGMWFCMPSRPTELDVCLRGCSWAEGGQVLHGWLCFVTVEWTCVTAGGVVGPVPHSSVAAGSFHN